MTAESAAVESRRQPLEPICSPTRALVELVPNWKIAEPGRPATCTTPTSSGEFPWAAAAGRLDGLAAAGEPLAAGAGRLSGPLTGTRSTCGWREPGSKAPGSWLSCWIQGSFGGGGGTAPAAAAAALSLRPAGFGEVVGPVEAGGLLTALEVWAPGVSAVPSPLSRSNSHRVRSWRRSRLAWFQPCQQTRVVAPASIASDPRATSLSWAGLAWLQAAQGPDLLQRQDQGCGWGLPTVRAGPAVQNEATVQAGPPRRDGLGAGEGSSRTSTSIIGSLAAASDGAGMATGWR